MNDNYHVRSLVRLFCFKFPCVNTIYSVCILCYYSAQTFTTFKSQEELPAFNNSTIRENVPGKYCRPIIEIESVSDVIYIDPQMQSTRRNSAVPGIEITSIIVIVYLMLPLCHCFSAGFTCSSFLRRKNDILSIMINRCS